MRGRLVCTHRLILRQLALLLQRFPSSLRETRMVPPLRYSLLLKEDLRAGGKPHSPNLTGPE
jgi:hypothetical protein